MSYKLEVLWCRTFQAVLKLGNYFMGYRMPKYLEGPGKVRELGTFLKEKGIDDVLVVTDAGLKKLGLPDRLDMIREEDIDQMIDWAKKEANPLYPVPVVWSRRDFRRVIESVRK